MKQMLVTGVHIRKAINCLPAILFMFLAGCAGTVSHNYQLGVEALDKGNYDTAIEHLSSYVKSKPDDADAHLKLGLALLKKGSLQEAVDEFKKSLALDPRNSQTSAIIKTGIMEEVTRLLDQENDELAMRYLTAHLTINPDDFDTNILLTKEFIKMGSTRNAIQCLRKAVSLDPKNPEAIELLDYFADGFH